MTRMLAVVLLIVSWLLAGCTTDPADDDRETVDFPIEFEPEPEPIQVSLTSGHINNLSSDGLLIVESAGWKPPVLGTTSLTSQGIECIHRTNETFAIHRTKIDENTSTVASDSSELATDCADDDPVAPDHAVIRALFAAQGMNDENLGGDANYVAYVEHHDCSPDSGINYRAQNRLEALPMKAIAGPAPAPTVSFRYGCIFAPPGAPGDDPEDRRETVYVSRVTDEGWWLVIDTCTLAEPCEDGALVAGRPSHDDHDGRARNHKHTHKGTAWNETHRQVDGDLYFFEGDPAGGLYDVVVKPSS